MTNQILLELPTDEMYVFLQLVPKFKGRVLDIREENQKTPAKSAIDFLEELAQMGGVHSITDPSEWQREIRKDRPIYFEETTT